MTSKSSVLAAIVIEAYNKFSEESMEESPDSPSKQSSGNWV